MGKITSINLNGKDYPMSFSLMVMKQISKKYGSVEKAFKKLKDEMSGDMIEVITHLLSLTIASGCAYKNYFEKDVPATETDPVVDGKWSPLTEEELCYLITAENMDNAAEALAGCLNGGKEQETESVAKGKNAEAKEE